MKNILPQTKIDRLWLEVMRVQRAKRAVEHQSDIDTMDYNITGSLPCGVGGGDTVKEPIVVTCKEKKEVGLPMDGQLQQENITLASDSCVGEAILQKISNILTIYTRNGGCTSAMCVFSPSVSIASNIWLLVFEKCNGHVEMFCVIS